MNIYRIYSENGITRAFEIENTCIGKGLLYKIIEEIPNTIVLNENESEDTIITFTLNDEKFIVEEFYGDNSRYWIGKYPSGGACKELDLLVEKFSRFPENLEEKTSYYLRFFVIKGVWILLLLLVVSIVYKKLF